MALATFDSKVTCACIAILSASFVIAFLSTSAFISIVDELSFFWGFSLQEKINALQKAIRNKVNALDLIMVSCFWLSIALSRLEIIYKYTDYLLNSLASESPSCCGNKNELSYKPIC